MDNSEHKPSPLHQCLVRLPQQGPCQMVSGPLFKTILPCPLEDRSSPIHRPGLWDEAWDDRRSCCLNCCTHVSFTAEEQQLNSLHYWWRRHSSTYRPTETCSRAGWCHTGVGTTLTGLALGSGWCVCLRVSVCGTCSSITATYEP